MAATSKTIINNVAIECGLTEVADPYASLDQNFILLRALLNTSGRELIDEYDWPHLIKEGIINPIDPPYEPPADYARWVQRTAWVTSLDQEMTPLTYKEYAAVSALSIPLDATPAFIQLGSDIITFPTLTGENCSFLYVSRYWTVPLVACATQLLAEHYGPGTMELPTQSTDWVLFPEHTITRLLKLKFLQSKGLDAAATAKDYARALEAAKNTAPRAILSLTGNAHPKIIDGSNIPDTGYGS